MTEEYVTGNQVLMLARTNELSSETRWYNLYLPFQTDDVLNTKSIEYQYFHLK